MRRERCRRATMSQLSRTSVATTPCRVLNYPRRMGVSSTEHGSLKLWLQPTGRRQPPIARRPPSSEASKKNPCNAPWQANRTRAWEQAYQMGCDVAYGTSCKPHRVVLTRRGPRMPGRHLASQHLGHGNGNHTVVDPRCRRVCHPISNDQQAAAYLTISCLHGASCATRKIRT